jgi:CelD/BcsL family acetyltransferase involved in cellulose biosynthesis
VHTPDLQWEPQELLRACRLAVWEFDHLVAGQKPFERYETQRHASPIMDFTSGFDACYAQLVQNSARSEAGSPTQSINELPRKERRIGRQVGELRFVYDCQDAAVLQTLMTWKSAQYQRTGAADRFARRWIVDLLHELLRTRTDDFSGVLSALYAGDELIAAVFLLRSDDVMAEWFPAYHAGLGKYSPGLLLRSRMAEAAAAGGIRHIDLGRGPETYKELFKSSDLVVSEGRVARRSPVAAVRWAQQASVRRLHDVVVGHRPLYRVADRMRKGYGRIDSAVRRRSGDLPHELTR